jgi:hypothetical protein
MAGLAKRRRRDREFDAGQRLVQARHDVRRDVPLLGKQRRAGAGQDQGKTAGLGDILDHLGRRLEQALPCLVHALVEGILVVAEIGAKLVVRRNQRLALRAVIRVRNLRRVGAPLGIERLQFGDQRVLLLLGRILQRLELRVGLGSQRLAGIGAEHDRLSVENADDDRNVLTGRRLCGSGRLGGGALCLSRMGSQRQGERDHQAIENRAKTSVLRHRSNLQRKTGCGAAVGKTERIRNWFRS